MKAKTDLTVTFTSFLQQQNLENHKLLLMVSGGVDSVVLLHVATQTVKTANLAVFHLNHKVREESDADEIFVQNLCSNLNIKFYGEVLDPGINNDAAGRSRDQSRGGVESTWRKERQKFSAKAAADFGAARILTAHHATDLVETMIFRLTKGTGPNGLSPFETRTKPFWKLPKIDLVKYAQANEIKWREDASNLNTKFERNLIRTEVLPALRKITPNLEAVFVRESNTFTEITDFMATELQSKCGAALNTKSLSLTQFLNLHPALQTEFLRTIAAKPISQSEIEDALKWLRGNPKGNSKKEIGDTPITLQQDQLRW